ncbi:MAG: DUF2029 domain-containing protein [Acidobacteria bacterium]|nr:DUF2029 domain-containing protein [Acidobacteriota bacterium]
MTTTSRFAAALGLVAVIGYGLAMAFPTADLRDYGSFVASGRAASVGDNPYGVYPLTFHVVLPGIDVWNPNLNPPISVLLFEWFDRVEPSRGFRLWWLASMACYVVTIALLLRRYEARHPVLVALWALALAGFWDTLALGQIYLPLVLAAVGAWLLLERDRPVAAGLLIGLVVAFKPNFAVWPALLLLAGHGRVATAAAGAAAMLSAVPLATHGPGIYRQWIALILADEGRAGFLTNASLAGLAHRLGAPDAGMAASVLLLLALAAWAARRRPGDMRASEFGIAAAILASPLAWVHYTLFLLPVFVARTFTPLFVASAVLLVVPVPVLLRLLGAPAWQQATVGSVYNWAVLLCLAGLMFGARHRRDPERTIPQPHGVPSRRSTA